MRSNMAQKSYRALLVVLALTGALLDQTSKYSVFSWLNHDSARYDAVRNMGSFTFDKDWFEFLVQYTKDPVASGNVLQSFSSDQMPRVNKGALFGLLNNHEGLANGLFAFISVLAGVAIVGWSFRPNTARDRLLCSALGLILAGTMGNLYDRIVFGGVRDFLHFHHKDEFEWPVFNVADCCLVGGAFLLLAQAFLTHPVPATDPAAAAEESLPAPQVAPVQ